MKNEWSTHSKALWESKSTTFCNNKHMYFQVFSKTASIEMWSLIKNSALLCWKKVDSSVYYFTSTKSYLLLMSYLGILLEKLIK